MAEFVHVDVTDGVATIRLDRGKMNALNDQIQDELAEAAREVDEREDIAAVVIYGGERVFAAGADIKQMREMSYQQMAARSRHVQAFTRAIANIGKPTVAAVNGFALGGGCEVALACDVRFSAADATWGQPEILLGIIPGAGGTQRLARLIGPAKAKDLIFSGRFVDAAEAESLGLVDRVVTDVHHEAVEWARQFTGGASIALRAAKEAIDRGLESDVDTGLEIERIHFSSLFATEDQKTGMASFVENGPGHAVFEGR